MHKNNLIKIILLIGGVSVIMTTAIVLLHSNHGQNEQSKSLFGQFVVAGGWIVWFVLLPMSMFMVYLAVEHSLTINTEKITAERNSKDNYRDFAGIWAGPGLRENRR